MSWTSGVPLVDEAPAQAAPQSGAGWTSGAPLYGQGPARTAQGFWESVQANWQASSAGLYLRGKAPDVFANPELPWYDRVGGAVAGLVGDVPAMAVGGFAGAALPVPGPGKAIVGGAGVFAAPAVIREALMQHYTTGELDYGKLAVVGAKEAVVGAATFWAGGAVSKMLPVAGTTATTAERIGQGVLRQGAIGGAELGAMMGARSIVDWRIPDSHEFIDNAVLIFGLRGAREYGVPALMKIYESTGKTPKEVVADAGRDSNIAQEVLQGKVPEAYLPLTVEPRGEPGVKPAPRPSDPAPLERAVYNLRHVTDEATARAEITRAGADHLAAIEASRRGVVSRSETLAASEQAASWLRDTIGEGRATREVGTPAGDAQIVGYARVMEQLLRETHEMAAKLREVKANDKALPDEVVRARAEYAQAEQQLRMITADYLGATAEIGRSLRAIRYIKDAVGDVKKLDEALNVSGGKGGVDFRASMLAEMTSNKRTVDFIRRAGAFDKVVEYWKASVLSGPTTQAINFISNSVFTLSRVPRTFSAAMVAEATGSKNVMYREAIAEGAGLIMGLKEGVTSFGRTFYNAYKDGGGIEAGKMEARQTAIEGTAGKVIRTPFVLLEAADVLFKSINGYATRYASASRNITADKMLDKRAWQDQLATAKDSQGVMQQAVADGLRYTFQTELGPKAKRLIGALYDTPLKYVMPFVLPFVRTPVNIYGEAVRMMPGIAVLSGRAREEYAKGGAARDQVIGNQIMGGAIAMTVVSLVDAGVISGSGPADPAARQALLERGWKPYSIRIGDEWYSYSRIEPFATLVGVVADLWSAKHLVSNEEYEMAANALMQGFRQQVTNKTWLVGVANLMTLATPDEYGGSKVVRAVGDMLGGFIPNIGAQIDREFDEHLRDTRSFVDKLQNRIPLLRRGLLPKRDSFGQPMTYDSLFPFSGIQVSAEKNDPVRNELARLGYAPQPIRETKVDVTPGPIKGEVELNPEQLDSLRTRAGGRAYEVLSRVIQSPGYQTAPKEYQRSVVEQVFSAARQEARFGVIPAQQIQQTVRESVEKSKRNSVK